MEIGIDESRVYIDSHRWNGQDEVPRRGRTKKHIVEEGAVVSWCGQAVGLLRDRQVLLRRPGRTFSARVTCPECVEYVSALEYAAISKLLASAPAAGLTAEEHAAACTIRDRLTPSTSRSGVVREAS